MAGLEEFIITALPLQPISNIGNTQEFIDSAIESFESMAWPKLESSDYGVWLFCMLRGSKHPVNKRQQSRDRTRENGLLARDVLCPTCDVTCR